MNLAEEGEPIARIIGKAKPNVLYLKYTPTAIKEIFIEKATESMQQIPNSSKERDVLYITGESGSGKSYYIVKYLKQYLKQHPTNQIYLFSALDSDPTIDKLKDKIKRIKFTPQFIATQFTIQDFENSCVIFDDYDAVLNKQLIAKLESLMFMILTTGRHTKTSCIVVTHNAYNRDKTKTILNECSSVTVFPLNTAPKTIHYLLNNYFGLEKNQIQRLKQLHKHSRWVTLLKVYPKVVLYDKGAYLLNTE